MELEKYLFFFLMWLKDLLYFLKPKEENVPLWFWRANWRLRGVCETRQSESGPSQTLNKRSLSFLSCLFFLITEIDLLIAFNQCLQKGEIMARNFIYSSSFIFNLFLNAHCYVCVFFFLRFWGPMMSKMLKILFFLELKLFIHHSTWSLDLICYLLLSYLITDYFSRIRIHLFTSLIQCLL